ncbi:MAG: hypothetical protein CVV05_00915 [Gammaproteobacteria bacterium HGW-Gammaproteobacteria-1]|nr:MAG: hypothetical protein CVV05_00915 [Gammaproteobacteria bacterium HGW-Gammaproteobacteria-1]
MELLNHDSDTGNDMYIVQITDAPLVDPVLVMPVVFQGHGAKARFFRHVRLDDYAISTIGEAIDPTTLASPYETRMFRIGADGQYIPIDGVASYRTRNMAVEGHQRLVRDVTDKLEDHRRREAITLMLSSRSLGAHS